MKEPGSNYSIKRLIAISQLDMGGEILSSINIPSLKIDKINSIDPQVIADYSLILLVAPERDFLLQAIKQIRGYPKTTLTPLIVATERDYLDNYHQLADIVLPLPLKDSYLVQGVHELIPLAQKVENFPSVPTSLERKEESWLNLLRFLNSRQNIRLTPQWNMHTQQGCSYPVANIILNTHQGQETAQLETLSQMGLLETTFYDKIHLCPQCRHFQLNFREVCPDCRTSNINLEENIHHYSCSLIAPEKKFQQGNNLICPKCRQRLESPGVDYDQPSSAYHCVTCQHPFSEAQVDCLCLSCGLKFPASKAQSQTIWEYNLSSLGWQAAQNGFVSQDKLKKFLHQQLGVLDYEIFKTMLEIELNFSLRDSRRLCLIKLKIENYPYDMLEDACTYRLWGKLMGNLRENLRVNDLITWMGGEEILILSVGTRPKQAAKAIKRIQQNVTCNWPEINLLTKIIPLNPEHPWEAYL